MVLQSSVWTGSKAKGSTASISIPAPVTERGWLAILLPELNPPAHPFIYVYGCVVRQIWHGGGSMHLCTACWYAYWPMLRNKKTRLTVSDGLGWSSSPSMMTFLGVLSIGLVDLVHCLWATSCVLSKLLGCLVSNVSLLL